MVRRAWAVPGCLQGAEEALRARPGACGWGGARSAVPRPGDGRGGDDAAGARGGDDVHGFGRRGPGAVRRALAAQRRGYCGAGQGVPAVVLRAMGRRSSDVCEVYCRRRMRRYCASGWRLRAPTWWIWRASTTTRDSRGGWCSAAAASGVAWRPAFRRARSMRAWVVWVHPSARSDLGRSRSRARCRS